MSSGASPRSPTSAKCTARWRRSGTCGRATGAPSCRSVRRSPIALSHCRAPIAPPSTRSSASPSRCAPSSCTSGAASGSAWCTCRRSTRRSSPGRGRGWGSRRVPPAGRSRREVYLGGGTVKAILGDAALPGFADRVAVRAWDGPLTGVPIPEREGNLFAPVTGVRRDRLPFVEDASPRALRVSARQTRVGLALGAGALLGLTAALARAAGRR